MILKTVLTNNDEYKSVYYVGIYLYFHSRLFNEIHKHIAFILFDTFLK